MIHRFHRSERSAGSNEWIVFRKSVQSVDQYLIATADTTPTHICTFEGATHHGGAASVGWNALGIPRRWNAKGISPYRLGRRIGAAVVVDTACRLVRRAGCVPFRVASSRCVRRPHLCDSPFAADRRYLDDASQSSSGMYLNG